jgi:hypothetical protein
LSALAGATAFFSAIAALEERLKVQESKTAALEAKVAEHAAALKAAPVVNEKPKE